MDQARERALTLAHEDETQAGYAAPDKVVDRARQYLDFLRGAHDAEIISAARGFAAKISS